MRVPFTRNGRALLNLPGYLALVYTLFLTGFFLIQNAVDLYKFYSVALFLPGLFALRPALAKTGRNTLFYAILAYLVYMLLTSFWSVDFSASELFDDARLAAYILVFLLIAVLISAQDRKLFENIIRLTAVCAGLAAVVSIALWYTKYPAPRPRLTGIGIIDNPNPSAFAYGFFAILNGYYALQSGWPGGRMIFFSLCTMLLFLVLLTGSNTGILATASAIALLLVLHQHSHKLLLAGGVLAGVAAVLYLLWSLGLLSSPVDAGFSQRLPVWHTVLNQWLAAPVFGNGYQAELLLTPAGDRDIANWAHNALLATLRDGGITGLILHLLVLGSAARAAARFTAEYRDPIYLVLLLFGFICMTADTNQLITRPMELWIIFWLPLAMILARETARSGRSFSRQAVQPDD